MSLIEDILREAEEVVKTANDAQGAPETANNSNTGQTDIISTANAFLQELEQFKAQVGQQVAEGGQPQGEPEGDEGQPQVDENGQPIGQPQQQAAGGATIQTPGGSVIKLASIIKLASCYGRNLFGEVK